MFERWIVALSVALLGCSGGGGGGGVAGSGGTDGGGGGTGGGGASGTIGEYCSSTCARVHECDNSRDTQTCAAQCNNQNAALGPKYRPEYLQFLTSCSLGKDCVTVIAGSAVDDCSKQATAALAPSSAGLAFCDSYEQSTLNCSKQFDKATCLGTVKFFSDATLLAAQACTSKGCSAVDSCVDASFGIPLSISVIPSSCTDTCTYSSDGTCDDGGPGASYSLCALGTDCTDCGPR